jgi:Cu-Zn family superoxide dismutase
LNGVVWRTRVDRMNTTTRLLLVPVSLAFASVAHAQAPADTAAATGPIVVKMNIVTDEGGTKAIGTITATDSGYGLILQPALTGLPPGLHGFHVHEKPNCAPAMKDGKMEAAQGAGGHLDPASTGRHEGPYGTGHLGDLPAIYVGPGGKAEYPVLAPRLKAKDLVGHSLMIHAGGDNHADHPAPLGGGGPRMACGIIEAPRTPK